MWNDKKQGPPVKVGEILKLGVRGLGKTGDFMFKHKGYNIFLKNPENKPVVIGVQFEIKIAKVLDKFGFAVQVKSCVCNSCCTKFELTNPKDQILGMCNSCQTQMDNHLIG